MAKPPDDTPRNDNNVVKFPTPNRANLVVAETIYSIDFSVDVRICEEHNNTIVTIGIQDTFANGIPIEILNVIFANICLEWGEGFHG